MTDTVSYFFRLPAGSEVGMVQAKLMDEPDASGVVDLVVATHSSARQPGVPVGLMKAVSYGPGIPGRWGYHLDQPGTLWPGQPPPPPPPIVAKAVAPPTPPRRLPPLGAPK